MSKSWKMCWVLWTDKSKVLMQEVYFNTVQEFNDFYHLDTLHPLVSVVRFDKPRTLEEVTCHYGLYALFLKENKGCKLSYGRTKYDFDEMTVTSFAPGQVIHVEPQLEAIGGFLRTSGTYALHRLLLSGKHSSDLVGAQRGDACSGGISGDGCVVEGSHHSAAGAGI